MAIEKVDSAAGAEREQGTRLVLYASLAAGMLLQLQMLIGLAEIGRWFMLTWSLHLVLHFLAVCGALYLLGSMIVRSGARGRIALAVSCLGLIPAVIWALAPVTARDALIYHLFVPRTWIVSGAIVEIPWHEWSYFPLLPAVAYSGFLKSAGVLQVGAFALGPEQFSALYHLSYYVLLAALVSLQTRSILAFVFIATLPLCVRLAGEPMADFPAAHYFAAAYFWLFGDVKGGESRFAAPGRRQLVLAGIAGGLAVSCKYSAVLGIALLAASFFYYLIVGGRTWRDSLAAVSAFSAMVFLIAFPWLLKNYLWTSNPFFPFLASFFGDSGKATPFVGETPPLVYRMRAFGETPADLLLIPLRMIFFGEDGNPKQFAGVLNPLVLFAAVPLAGAFGRSQAPVPAIRLRATALLWLCYFLLSILLFHALVRYQVLLAGPITWLVVCGAAQLTAAMQRFFAKMPLAPSLPVSCFFIIAAVCASIYWQRSEREIDALRYLAGGIGKSQYLSAHLSEYDIARAVNELPADSLTYLLYTGNRYYLYERKVRGEYFSGRKIFSLLSRRSLAALSAEELAEELRRSLREEGFTHLAIHNRRAAQVFSANMGKREQRAWQMFGARHLELTRRGRFASLWRIK